LFEIGSCGILSHKSFFVIGAQQDGSHFRFIWSETPI